MAKVKGPLFSMDARGQIGKALVYGGWKGIAWVREWFIPENPQSTLQTKVRDIFTLGVLRWQGLDADTKTGWETGADRKGKTQSGFNYFMSEYVKDMWAGDAPSDTSPL